MNAQRSNSKWQKAKVVDRDIPMWHGRTLWVRPMMGAVLGLCESTRRLEVVEDAFGTHILNEDPPPSPGESSTYGIQAASVELLPEFADEVALIGETDWLAESSK